MQVFPSRRSRNDQAESRDECPILVEFDPLTPVFISRSINVRRHARSFFGHTENVDTMDHLPITNVRPSHLDLRSERKSRRTGNIGCWSKVLSRVRVAADGLTLPYSGAV